MSTVFIKRYDAVNKHQIIVDDLFKQFMDSIIESPSKRQGRILIISADIGTDNPLETLFEGGGIGKTKVLEHMYKYYSNRASKSMPIPIIDMFEETTTFLIWAKIMANLLCLLNIDEKEAGDIFPSSINFLNSIKPDQDNIADDLSKKALKNFRHDIEINYEVIQEKVKQNSPCILFIDSFEYIDKEIKKILDEYKNKISKNSGKSGVIKARLKRFQHYNFSLFDDLKNDAHNGILDILTRIGISIVISGRVVKGFSHSEIDMSCRVGLLQDNEMQEYIEKVEEIAFDSSKHKELFDKIKHLTQSRPILVYIFFQLVRIQQEKEQRKPEDANKSIEGIISDVVEREIQDKNGFEKAIFSNLYNKTDKLLTSTVLYYMSIAEDGVSKKVLADFCDLGEKDYDFKELINQLTKWAYTKRKSLIDNLSDLKSYIDVFLKNIGIRIGEEEYRLHDEMVDLILKHHWASDLEGILDQKKKYLIDIVEAYRKHYLNDIPNEEARKKLREYLGYQLELAEVENALIGNARGKESQYFENVASEIAYRYISAIDEFPDHAARILNKATYFFEDKPFSSYKARILLLRIDHFLTISEFQNAELEIQRFEEELEKIDYKDIEFRWESIRAVLFAHKAQLNIWQGKIIKSKSDDADDAQENINTTKEYLQKSSRLAYRTGARATLAWTAHLWGWLFQRKGEFVESMNWHKKALNAAITSSSELLEEAKEYSYQGFETQYQISLLSKIIGRTLGNMVFTYKESGEIEESLFVSNLLLFFLSKQKNDSREEVRALIGNLISNILWGASLENTQKVAHILENIGDYEDENLQLSMANVNAVYKYKDIGINTYLNYYLPNEFEEAVKNLQEKDKNAVNESKAILEKYFDGLSTGEIKKKNLNYAKAFYQYGKSCLISINPIHDKVDYERARSSFENAKIISKEIGYKYLELEAMEALFTLSYLAQGEENSETKKCREEFKTSFFSYLPEWEYRVEEYQNQFFDEKIKAFINLDDVLYKDILAKFFTTEGNIIFNKSILDKNYKEDAETWKNWQEEMLKAFSSYNRMLHFSYLHNENRYTLSLNILYTRLEGIVKNKEKKLIQTLKDKIGDRDSSYFIKDTDFIKFSNILWKIMDIELDIAQVPIETEKELNKQKNIEESIVKGIFDLDSRGQFQKSLILTRSLLNHRLYNFNINYEGKGLFKDQALFHISEEIAIGNFNLCFNLLLNNKGGEINEVVVKFKKNKKLKEYLSKSQYNALEAGLNIMQLTSEYRNQEFWTIERFLEGELAFFISKKYHNSNQVSNEATSNSGIISKIMSEFEVNLNKIINYCIELESSGNIHQNGYRYLRLLSECCIRLGEFCMLSGTNFEEKNNTDLSFTEKLKKLFEKLIDPSNNSLHRWSNPLELIKEHADSLGENSAAFYLSYAYHLSKFTARTTQDYRRTAYCLEAIGNIYYLEGKFELKLKGIPATVKYLCLNDKVRDKFDDSKNPKRPYENNILKDKYIAEEDIRYPLILAYMKIVEGDYIYSQLFEINPKAYVESATYAHHQSQGKLKLPAFMLRESSNNKEMGDKSKRRMMVRKMILHYLKSLNMFAITPYRTFTYKNMVLELERRLLLVPDDYNILKNIEEDLTTIWLNFNNLKNREDSLERLVILLKVRRLCLALGDGKFKPVEEKTP